MNEGTSVPGSNSSVVHAVRPERDLAANWEVDLAKQLEDYLLKICSGTITDDDKVNFSEAALLVQNSVQVYSRKVEYLYTLVLRTIEFLSRSRQQNHSDDTSDQPEERGSHALAGGENIQFWNLEEIPGFRKEQSASSEFFSEAAIAKASSANFFAYSFDSFYAQTSNFASMATREDPSSPNSSNKKDPSWKDPVLESYMSNTIDVEENITLDSKTEKEVNLNGFVKPPANLVVPEGDCFDTTGDAGELESYLLSSTRMYKDFMLLDKSDADAVDELLKGNQADTMQNGAFRESSTHKSFLSQTTRSGGTANKSSVGKNQHVNCNHSPQLNCDFDANNAQSSSPASTGFDNGNFGFEMNDGIDASRGNNSSDDDDPWKKRLNPHEPGDLKVMPFRKVKAKRRNCIFSKPQESPALSSDFPIPTHYDGPTSSFLMEAWEKEYQRRLQADPYYYLYDYVREHMVDQANKSGDESEDIPSPGVYNNNGNGNPDFDAPGNDYMDEDTQWGEKKNRDDSHVEVDEDIDHEVPNSQPSLEDLCCSHMDALLAKISETERQTGITARVSKWKKTIEQVLEEQASRPPFDIHEYGERILEKLSLEASNGSVMLFSDLVKGQQKYDVARSFVALLQLATDGDVDLVKSEVCGESVSCTTGHHFHVRLLNHGKKRKGNMEQQCCNPKRIADLPFINAGAVDE